MQFYIYYILDFLLKVLIKLNKKLIYQNLLKILFTQGMVCHETYKDEMEIGYILMK